MRASCETDLAKEFPLAVVVKWPGDTQAVAMRHYVDVTDDPFERAAGWGDPETIEAVQEAAQNPAQSAHERGGNTSQTESPAHAKTPVLQGLASSCEAAQNRGLEDRGLEPLTFWLPARRSPN